MRVLVIGGTLFIGRLLVKELLEAGHEVTVLHRKPSHDLGRKVKGIQADRNHGKAMEKALAGKQFDGVFDNVYDWQRGTTADQVLSTIEAVAGKGLSRYVFMSSIAAYGDGLNHQEDDALAPDDHADPYVRNKAMTERLLFRLYHRHKLPVVTLRPPFVYGPGNPFYREAFFWDRLRDKRQIIVPSEGLRLMQFVFVKDLVWAAVQTLELPAAVGQAFNISDAKPVSQLDALNALAEAAKKRPQIVSVPRDFLVRSGGHPMGPKLYFGEYLDLPPITQMVNKAKRVLKLEPTPFLEGLRETHRWWQRNAKFKKPDYSFEDEVLGKLTASVAR